MDEQESQLFKVPFQPLKPDDTLMTVQGQGVEVVRICADGRLFWKGREVETDADFRSAIMDVLMAMLPHGVGR